MGSRWRSTRKALISIACLVFLVALSENVSADMIRGCPSTVINDSVLKADLNSSGTCLIIGASNIVLDCFGYSITGDGSGYGINASGKSNVTIKNCNIEGYQYGIYLNSSSVSTITNNTLNNTLWDFYSTSNSINNTVVSLTLNPTISFTGKDIAIKVGSSPASDPSGYQNIGKYINATNNSVDSWLFLNVSYTDADVASVEENTLRMWKHNGSWSQVPEPNGVDTANNYVYANITGFSVFTPLGNDITPPTINITSPQNRSYEHGTAIVLSYTADEPISWNWYRLDGVGDINAGFENGSTTITPDIGSHNITIYANDSANNWGNDTEYFTVTAPSPPPINNGGGGETPFPLRFTFNSITSSVMGDIVQQLGLAYKQFYNTTNITGSIAHELSLAATLITVDKYPDISYLGVTLGKPVKTLSGNIYEISSELVLDRYFRANTLIIARGVIPADSMASVAYAKSGNMPIILTKSDELPIETLDAIKALKPSKIIIVGGPVTVSSEVEAELANLATVERIWGQTRIETAIELAKMIENPDTIVVTDAVNPTADAVISAGGYKAPLIYVDSTKAFALEEVPQPVRDYLIQHKGTRIVFGFGVTDSAKSEIIGLME